eukprot:GILI01023890.1.p1 GENE.GILI01023890.1~~GILI01023890.1.p1  ORF type:complete len:160 (+),score=15.10 GILI01023890.1:77-556(+)
MSPQVTVTASRGCANREEVITAANELMKGTGLDLLQLTPKEVIGGLATVLPENCYFRLTCHISCKGATDVFPILIFSTNPTSAGRTLAALCESITSSPRFEAASAVFSLMINLIPFRPQGGRISDIPMQSASPHSQPPPPVQQLLNTIPEGDEDYSMFD